MRILMINVDCGFGSTGRICTDIAEELLKQGHEVKIAYGRDCNPKYEKNAIRVGNTLDIYIHVAESRLFDNAGFGSKYVTIRFVEWIKEYNPDVIHLHNLHGYYINVEILINYLKTCGKKIIWTLHDCWAFTGHTAYCDVANCMRWKNGCGSCPLLKEYPYSFVDRSSYNWQRKRKLYTGIRNLTIVTPSKWLASWLKDSILKEYQVRVINNGIDIDQFYSVESKVRKQNNLESKYLLLGVSSIWNNMKGYCDFIELSKRLDDRFRIIMVGLSRKQIESLPSNIIGIERTASVKELAEIYSSADLFMNLSFCENYPTVNIEAMACGTPVLTYQTGGSPEIVEKYGGIVVPKGDINQLETKVYEAMKNGCDCEFRNNENSVSNMVEQYLALYLIT